MSQPFELPSASGVDPFDALRSTRLPAFVRRSARLRQAVIQVRKRLPVELSGLLGIRPFVMAKTLGCLLTADARASDASDAEGSTRAEGLVAGLPDTGSGYGYEFDVQTRWAFYVAGSPNLIATSFVGRGLLLAGTVHGRDDWVAAGVRAARYALESLTREVEGHRVFFYTPDTQRLIHNANALGAALCVQAGVLAHDAELVDAAMSAAAYASDAQAADGSWPYGVGPGLSWVDSFHTAYTLDGLLQVWLASRDDRVLAALQKGATCWADNFIGPAGEPFYTEGAGPFDIHSAASAVDVGGRLSCWDLLDPSKVRSVDEWTRANLVAGDGVSTYYRRGRVLTDRRHFARWGDAHWAMARATTLMRGAGKTDAVERRLSGVRS